MNPNYRPSNKYVRPGLETPAIGSVASSKATLAVSDAGATAGPSTSPAETKEVVLNGVAFERSGRSLVRKDCES